MNISTKNRTTEREIFLATIFCLGQGAFLIGQVGTKNKNATLELDRKGYFPPLATTYMSPISEMYYYKCIIVLVPTKLQN